MSVRRFVPVLIFVLALAGRTAVSQAQAPVAAPAANAVTFTEEEAARGAEVFGGVCVECHGRKEFSDAEFKGKWRGQPAFAFFDRIRSTMPESGPGTLARQQYLDLVAYVAKLNGLTAGAAGLPDDDELLKKQILSFAPAL